MKDSIRFTGLLGIVLAGSLLRAAITIQTELAIPYQGTLEHRGTNTSIDETVEMRCYLYAEKDASEPIWARSFLVTPDKNRNFSLVLNDTGTNLLNDDTKTLARAIATQSFDEPLWLAVRVSDAGSEWTERQPFYPLPRAHAAIYADSAPNGLQVTGDLTLYTLNAEEMTLGGSINAYQLTVGDEESAEDQTVETEVLSAETTNAFVAPVVTCENAITIPTNAVNNDLFPVGSIIFWSGTSSNIPEGWALCDGTQGTPDLTDSFLMGSVKEEEFAKRFTADSITLSKEHVPYHTHTFRYRSYVKFISYSSWKDVDKDDMSWVGTKDFSLKTTQTVYGESGNLITTVEPFTLLPKYYAICCIQRIQ